MSDLDVISKSIDALPDDELIKLADVVSAIEKSSAKEIGTINSGFEKLKRALTESFYRDSSGHKRFSRSGSAESEAQKTDISVNSTEKNVDKAVSKQTEIDETHKNPIESRKKTEKDEGERKKTDETGRPRRKTRALEPVEITPVIANVASPALMPLAASPAIEPPTVAVPPRTQAKTAKAAPLIADDAISKYKKDAGGRLRNESGAFASKLEQKQYDKANNPSPEKEGEGNEPEKQTSLLKQVAFSVGRLALIGAGRGIGRNGLADTNSNVKTTLGVAAGGSYFLAAQEIATFMMEAKDSLKESGINSFGDAVQKVKDTAISAKDSVMSAGGRAVAMAKAVQVMIKGKDDAEPVKEEKPDAEKQASPLARMVEYYKSKTGAEAIKEGKPDAEKRASPFANIAQFFKRKEKPPASEIKRVEKVKQVAIASKPTKAAKSAPAWIKSGANPLFRFFNKFTPKSNKTDVESLAVQKSENQAAEQRHQESILALGDIEEAVKGIKGAGGSGGGLLGDALDFMGDKKKRKGRKGGSRTGRFESASRAQRVGASTRGSAFGNAGRAIGSVAGSGAGAGMGGGMMKAGGTALRAGGAVLSKLALPLTVAMAAYDGFQGYNDTEGQKEAFKLKDGEEASFGQKASMAAGSILSIGGLTEMIGLSSTDIAKAVYKNAGGEIEGEKSPWGELFSLVVTAVTGASKDVETPTQEAKSVDDKGDEVLERTPERTPEHSTERSTERSAERSAERSTERSTERSAAIQAESIDEQGYQAGYLALTPAIATTQPSRHVDDIEQIESLNKIQKASSDKASYKDSSNSINASIINSSDPEIVKLLKSIDQKLDGKGATRSAPWYSSQRTQSTAIPSDFTNESQKKQANNLG